MQLLLAVVRPVPVLLRAVWHKHPDPNPGQLQGSRQNPAPLPAMALQVLLPVPVAGPAAAPILLPPSLAPVPVPVRRLVLHRLPTLQVAGATARQLYFHLQAQSNSQAAPSFPAPCPEWSRFWSRLPQTGAQDNTQHW